MVARSLALSIDGQLSVRSLARSVSRPLGVVEIILNQFYLLPSSSGESGRTTLLWQNEPPPRFQHACMQAGRQQAAGSTMDARAGRPERKFILLALDFFWFRRRSLAAKQVPAEVVVHCYRRPALERANKGASASEKKNGPSEVTEASRGVLCSTQL